MRFHRLALSAVALLALNAFTGNNGYALATEETTTPPEDPPTETPTSSTPEIPENSETFAFQAEVNRMLDIVINSLYQNKNVFLRELISNASDALDKIRFLSIENPQLLEDKPEMEVRLTYDETEHTITVTDSGIGMTHDDLKNNLGTVARSGTTKFLEALQEGADIGTIGMFGVGFYSSFLVAERVKVASKHPDDPVQHVWESVNGDSSFHIYDDPRGNSLGRGTEITLYLKEDAYDYATSHKLEEVAKFYSEFISHPIHLRRVFKEMVPDDEVVDMTAGDSEEETDKEDKDDDEDEDDELDVGDEEDAEEGEEEPKKIEMKEEIREEWNQLNTKKPIWTREKEEITDKEYQDFFGVINRMEYSKAMYWTHFKAEGNINFKSIVYLPEDIPNELMQGRYDQMKKGVVKLYVRKVLISDEFPLLPVYLSWVKGVVDSDDLPLNVNRETLQESKIIRIIGKKMVRKILEMMKKLTQEPHPKKKKEKEVDDDDDDDDETDEVEFDADGNIVAKEKKDDEDKDDDDEEEEEEDDLDVDHPYIEFYRKYHPSLKLGIIRDESNRNRIAKLLRFKTSKKNGYKDWVSFDEYIENMKEWQEDIYYISGMSMEEVQNSHFMTKFKKRDVEVLFFIDPVDEIMMQYLKEYEGKRFQLITKEGTKLPDEDEDLEKRREKVYKEKFNVLTTYLRKKLSVSRVEISTRIEDAPALVSSAQYGQSATMERINAAQAFVQKGQDMWAQSSRVLEINPRHPIINKLLENVTPPASWEEDEEAETYEYDPGQETADLARTLYDIALINSGYRISDIKAHNKRLTRVLKENLALETLDVEDEIEIPEDDEDDDDDSESSQQYDIDGMPIYDAMDGQEINLLDDEFKIG